MGKHQKNNLKASFIFLIVLYIILSAHEGLELKKNNAIGDSEVNNSLCMNVIKHDLNHAKNISRLSSV